MAVYAGPVQDLIDELGRLPGVGPKGAQRIAFHLLTADPEWHDGHIISTAGTGATTGGPGAAGGGF